MADQTVASLFSQSCPRADIFIRPTDRKSLRRLAARLADLADRPMEEGKRALWHDHNALRDTRPVIFCDPENGWNEIITADQIQCEGTLARSWEMALRKEIFWGETMGDDKVIDAVFDVRHVYKESDWGMHERVVKVADHGSYRWDAPIKDFSQLDELHTPQITVDEEASADLLELAEKHWAIF